MNIVCSACWSFQIALPTFIQYFARDWPWYSLCGLHIRITWFCLYGIRIPLFSLYGNAAQTFERPGHYSW